MIAVKMLVVDDDAEIVEVVGTPSQVFDRGKVECR